MGGDNEMRTMLMSLRDDVYRKVLSGEKIYEHRKVFPDEPERLIFMSVLQQRQ